jgi:DNA polymerase III subunit delta'
MSDRAQGFPPSPLPWTRPLWSRLQGARRAGRLAHGLLLSGPLGVGKRQLAECLAQSLLCREPAADGRACGRCADCALLAVGNHPDLIRVAPDPDSKSGEITIAMIRGFSGRESLTPSRAACKIALIDPADRLNTAAANALLKTLEEPAGSTVLGLIAERPGALPATVRSRCLHLKVPMPTESEALAWLAEQVPGEDLDLRLRLAQGAPLRALKDFDAAWLDQRRRCLTAWRAVAAGEQDPIAAAAELGTLGLKAVLEWLASWMCDLLRLMVAAEAVRLTNLDQAADLSSMARRIPQAAGHRLLQRILEARALVDSSLNQQLLLESLAIDWSRIGGSQRRRT